MGKIDWSGYADIRLPEELRFTGTRNNPKPSPDYTLEELILTDNLWWLHNFAESLFVAQWDLMLIAYDSGPNREDIASTLMPANVEEVETALDLAFLGHVPDDLKQPILESCRRVRFWSLGGTTGAWDDWVSAKRTELDLPEGTHPSDALYDVVCPVSEIWEAYFDDKCISAAGTVRWDDAYRMKGLADLGRVLGIESAIEAFLSGVPIETLLAGKRSYDLDGRPSE